MDFESLMAQAAELQTKVADAQEKLANTVVKGIAENGACIVDMTGKYDLLKLTISPNVLGLGADAVARIVMAAYTDAKSKADAIIDKVMGEATAGMPMPQ
ncbi:MAG: YbaB/EbfC family nucleoid-associated protein [Alphaproteobacteria bacterium]|jgi:DNA-binding YbaB/EbfC family protein|nr:YbaB/EbfC family nucleoid-associated protein [Alphaproteobacteria bacterium]